MTIKNLCFVLGLSALAFGACKETPQGEKCANTPMPACIPPVDESASAELKKLHADIASRWSLAKITTIDTVHKNAPMGDYRNIRAELCLATNGGVQYFINNKELTCKLCYSLNQKGKDMFLEIDNTAANRFCNESVKSGLVTVSGDSLTIVSQDSFIIRTAIYRRLTADGILKTQ